MIHNTLPVAAQGAADLERPAGGDRRPLAGIFRVQVAFGKGTSWGNTVVFGVVRELLGMRLGCRRFFIGFAGLFVCLRIFRRALRRAALRCAWSSDLRFGRCCVSFF